MINLGKISPNGKEVILEEKGNGCIECISHCKDTFGYTRIMINGKHQRLFRYIYEQKYGKIPKGKVIRHKCDNSACCNINHLEIGIQKDNYNDMIERKRIDIHRPNIKCRGIKNKSNKLSEEQVKEIYLSKGRYKEFSDKFNISKTAIYEIRNKKMWKWFTDTLD